VASAESAGFSAASPEVGDRRAGVSLLCTLGYVHI
jgi:hypothetical protein